MKRRMKIRTISSEQRAQCAYCRMWLSVEMFVKDKSRRRGIKSFCKKCHNSIQRACIARRKGKPVKAKPDPIARQILENNLFWNENKEET